MLSFKQFLGEACWTGYKAVGLKKKGNKTVPNCVPEAANAAQQAAIAINMKKNNIKPKNEDLRKWFKQKWVRMDTKGNIKGQCARDPGEGKPKCLPQAKAHALGKVGRAAAARRKRREDPNPERRGAPINVRTK